MIKKLSLLWYIASAVLIGFALGFLNGMGLHLDVMPWLGACLAILGAPFGWLWWKQADEAVREAHKWAWFWGGGTGLLAGIVAGVADTRLGLDWLGPWFSSFAGTPLTPFEGGMFFLMVVMSISYAVAWGVWWLRHR